jgi:Leucine-rich repeat (LRR) protein
MVPLGLFIPQVGCLHHLEVLMAQHNQFSWVVPPAIGRCEKLTTLDLSNNDFRGDLPLHAFGTLSSLTSLSVSNNVCICGEVCAATLYFRI